MCVAFIMVIIVLSSVGPSINDTRAKVGGGGGEACQGAVMRSAHTKVSTVRRGVGQRLVVVGDDERAWECR